MEERTELYSQAKEAGQEAGQAAEEAREQAAAKTRQMGERMGRGVRELSETVADYVEKHPYAALGMAAAAGFMLSALLRR